MKGGTGNNPNEGGGAEEAEKEGMKTFDNVDERYWKRTR